MWPLTTMYMHNYLHQTLTTAGMVMLFMSIAMMAGNYVGGWLFDHWSQYRTALIGVGLSTLAIFLLIFIHGWPWIAQLTDVDEAGHYQGLLNITISVGRAIGPLYGGYVIEAGNYQLLFISTFLMMFITLLIVVGYLTRIHRLQARS